MLLMCSDDLLASSAGALHPPREEGMVRPGSQRCVHAGHGRVQVARAHRIGDGSSCHQSVNLFLDDL